MKLRELAELCNQAIKKNLDNGNLNVVIPDSTHAKPNEPFPYVFVDSAGIGIGEDKGKFWIIPEKNVYVVGE